MRDGATRSWWVNWVTALVVAGVVATGCSGSNEPDEAEISPATTAGAETPEVTARLAEAMDGIHGFSGSVLVARDEEVLLSTGYGLADAARGTENGPETRFRIGSLTKQVTGVAVLLLQQQDRLTVSDRACDYLTDCPQAWHPITIHHLLTHSSGLPDVTQMPQYMSARNQPITPARQLEWVRDLSLDFTPGSSFRYSNSGYLALGIIIEQVSGTSYEDFVQSEILGPLGMADSGYDTGDDGVAVGYTSGTMQADPINMVIPHAAGALYSTTQDLLRWQLSLLAGDLLDERGTETMTTPAIDEIGEPGFGYSYGIFVSLDPAERILGHGGSIDGFLSLLSHDMSTGVTVVVLSNQEIGPSLGEIEEVLNEAALD